MGIYVSVRGWLECDKRQLVAVQENISSHEEDRYSSGWGAPRRHVNWTHYIFLGAQYPRVSPGLAHRPDQRDRPDPGFGRRRRPHRGSVSCRPRS